MMKFLPVITGGLLIAASLSAGQASAEGSFSNPSSHKCSVAQEEMAGRVIADNVAEKIRDTVPTQSKRLIKIEDCQVNNGVVKTYFTYNYLTEKAAYAIDGKAAVDASGAVTLAQIDKPGIVYASIDSNYVE